MRPIASLIAAAIALAALGGCSGGEREDEERTEQDGGDREED